MAENPTWQLVVAGALQDREGRWLLHRRPAHKHHGGLWEFPGGKVETDETPANALIRELKEELGIEVGPGALTPTAFAVGNAAIPATGIVILLYTVRAWTGQPAALEAGAALAWFAPLEITTLERPPLDIALCAALFGADPADDGR